MVSYKFQLRPILSDNCFACHGPDVNNREAGLRLGIEEGASVAIKERPEFYAIVPSKPNQSVLVETIYANVVPNHI